MDRAALIEIIYRRMTEGLFLSDAGTLTYRVRAENAADEVLATMAAKPRRRSRVYLQPGEVEERDNTIIDMYHAGLSLEEIGEEMGMSGGGVWRVLKRRDVPRRKQGQRPYQIRNAS